MARIRVPYRDRSDGNGLYLFMNQSSTKVLFAPVSGPDGTGEYYRCLIIARVIARLRPDLEIHFLLNREARVEREAAFAYHLIEATPSLAIDSVVAIIEKLQPDLAVFDCTGRIRHFRAVKAAGGRLVWISNRPRKRRRGFHPAVLRLIDMHLIADSGNPDPEVGRLEQWLLRRFGPVRVEFINSVAPEPDHVGVELPDMLADLHGEYAVFASGGGGYQHQGRPVPEIFLEAAQRFGDATGMATVVVMGPQYRGTIDQDSRVHVVQALPTDQLGRLFAGARLAVIGAGYMISSHALTARLPVVMTAVGGRDQPDRVARYDRMGFGLAASLDIESLCRQALRLHHDPELARSLVRNAQTGGIRNDVRRVAGLLLEQIDSGTRGQQSEAV